MYCCPVWSADAAILHTAEVNLSENLDDASDSAVLPSPEDSKREQNQ